MRGVFYDNICYNQSSITHAAACDNQSMMQKMLHVGEQVNDMIYIRDGTSIYF
jgi:hypothetical protein